MVTVNSDKTRKLLLALLTFALLPSCMPVSYSYRAAPVEEPSNAPKEIELAGQPAPEPTEAPPEVEPQITKGEPHQLVDSIGIVFSIPAKIVLFNMQVETHTISDRTEQVIASYLELNNLPDVKVRLNEYSPGSEWNRLVDNKEIGWGWRYTVGVITWLGYTIFPGRLFGGDSYNPFTNTISLYSEHPSIALHEAGHAKDFAAKEYKGFSALVRILPIVPLFQEGDATSDALGYLQDNQCNEAIKDAYKVLYPAYGTYVGGEFARWIPGGALLSLAAAIPGHIVGRKKASEVETPSDAICMRPELVSILDDEAKALPGPD